jgi:excinuclease UvrABC nuclease subunit
MREAAGKLEFERAAHLRDQIEALNKGRSVQGRATGPNTKRKVKYR